MNTTIKVIEQELKRVDKQISSTLNSETMSVKDKTITLKGFLKQKEKLIDERNRTIIGHTATARGLEVKEPIDLSHGS